MSKTIKSPENDSEPCEACKGTGQRAERLHATYKRKFKRLVKCRYCAGTGEALHPYYPDEPMDADDEVTHLG